MKNMENMRKLKKEMETMTTICEKKWENHRNEK